MSSLASRDAPLTQPRVLHLTDQIGRIYASANPTRLVGHDACRVRQHPAGHQTRSGDRRHAREPDVSGSRILCGGPARSPQSMASRPDPGRWTSMTLRSFVFWPHLVSGVLAGTVVLTMSVTGVLLTYEKQMIARADASVRLSGAAADRLPPEALIARVAAEHAAVPVAVVMPAAPEKPALVTVRQTVHLVDPYSGATLGASAPRLRAFFRTVTDVHRWLAVQGEARAGARAVTGGANFLFLLMVLSGI